MQPGVSDEHLVAQAQAGDKDAFLTLYNRYLNIVYKRVGSRVPQRDVEDVTQNIFIAVVRSLDKFESRSLFSTWLYTIVSRQIADYYRKYYRSSEKDAMSIEAQEDFDIPIDNQNNVEELIVVKQALHALPENYQEIIMLRFGNGLTFAEVAESIGKSLEATKSLYRRAIQALTENIGRT